MWHKVGCLDLRVSGWQKLGGEDDEEADHERRTIVLVLSREYEQTAGNRNGSYPPTTGNPLIRQPMQPFHAARRNSVSAGRRSATTARR